MMAGFDFIGAFQKEQQENGGDFFTGVIDPTVFKKGKGEIHMVLIPGALLPQALVGNDPAALESLHLFSCGDDVPLK